jgi:hypothetical protein
MVEIAIGAVMLDPAGARSHLARPSCLAVTQRWRLVRVCDCAELEHGLERQRTRRAPAHRRPPDELVVGVCLATTKHRPT